MTSRGGSAIQSSKNIDNQNQSMFHPGRNSTYALEHHNSDTKQLYQSANSLKYFHHHHNASAHEIELA